jgi:hypothetical protein
MGVNTNPQLREKAIKWLNGKRDFNAGISLLQETGYKPVVASNIARTGEKIHTRQKLENEIRNYTRYFVSPENPLHEDETPELEVNDGVSDKIEKGNIQKELEKEYPDNVKRVLHEFNDLYQHRSMLHKSLKETGESNDSKAVTERKRIGLSMNAISRRLDDLWAAFELYKKDGTEPSYSLFETPFDPGAVDEVEETKNEANIPKTIELPDDLISLKKMKENLRIKILKTNNLLIYQSEKKQKKENPIPDSPKKVELEKRLDELKKQKEAVEYKIVALK